MFCFDRAAASVNPPSSNMMVGENICEKMYLVASGEVSRRSSPSVERKTRKTTTKKGTMSAVTKRGMI